MLIGLFFGWAFGPRPDPWAKMGASLEKCAMEGDRVLPEWERDLHALMVKAGSAAMAHFRSVEVETKPDSTPVTIADRAAEAVLVEGLQKLFPLDSIVSEEGAVVHGTSSRTWYVDPIDGTAAFIEGLSHWGPVVGCLDEDGPCIGAIYMPRTGDFLFGMRGLGAWLDGLLLPQLGEPASTRSSVVYVPSRFHQYVDFKYAGKLRSLGGTAAHLCGVATGAAMGAMIPRGWKLWDVVGPFCLLYEVGAVAMGQQDGVLDLRKHPSQAFVVSHPSCLDDVFLPSRFAMKG